MNPPELPAVAMWRIHLLRVQYLLIACVMGFFVWQQILFEVGPWPAPRIIAKAMLASLALLCVVAIRYPLQMLPVLILETLWKTVAILLIILPAWLAGRITPEQRVLFSECIGIAVAYFIIPWPYVWARYARQPSEPWRRTRDASAAAVTSLP